MVIDGNLEIGKSTGVDNSESIASASGDVEGCVSIRRVVTCVARRIVAVKNI